MPSGTEDRWFNWRIGSFPRILKRRGAPNIVFSFRMDFCKDFIFNDPNWDYSSYDLVNWEKDTQFVRTFANANNPDLSEFKARGGKLILWHGWADGGLTALGSIEYFEEVERRDPEVRDYFRLYLLPGVRHGGGGAGPDQVDWLAALVQWVEQGKAPYRLVASKHDEDGNVTMTRPIYPYPLRAIYKGSGSTNGAEKFLLPE
jgi:feruloyl esterase